MAHGMDEMDVPTIHRLLREKARKEVIREVMMKSKREDLSGYQIAAYIAQDHDKEVDELYGELRHQHLPILDNKGAIIWDEQTDEVTIGEYTKLLFDCMNEVEGWE